MQPLLDHKSTQDTPAAYQVRPGASDCAFYCLDGHTLYGVPSLGQNR